MPQSSSYLLGTKGHNKKKFRKQNLHIARIKCRSTLACFEFFFLCTEQRGEFHPRPDPCGRDRGSPAPLGSSQAAAQASPRSSSGTGVLMRSEGILQDFYGMQGRFLLRNSSAILTHSLELTGTPDLWLQLTHYCRHQSPSQASKVECGESSQEV